MGSVLFFICFFLLIEVEWKRVPDVCAEFSLMPRLVLYESADVVGAQGV